MDRVAVFVDAGYLFAAGSTALCGRKCPRGDLVFDHEAALRSLKEIAENVSGLPLLRIYWYDGTSAGPTSQQLTLAYHDDVKIRLGFVNSHGQQKGVDSLIVTDMIMLARNSAIADALLVSGDEDVRVGVQQAQEHGVRVHLLGIQTSVQNQSGLLRQEADTMCLLTPSEVGAFLSVRASEKTISNVGVGGDAHVSAGNRSAVAVAQAQAEGADQLIEQVVAEVIGRIPTATIHAIVSLASAGNLPADVDRRLLGTAKAKAGGLLERSRVRALRGRFFDECRVRALAAEETNQAPAE